MKTTSTSVLILFVAIFSASFAHGAGEVFLTMDPDKNVPTIVSETNPARRVEYLSVNYADPATPESFKLVFEPGFGGQFEVGPNWSTGTQNPATNEWEFQSAKQIGAGADCKYTPPGSGVAHDCEHVLIKLLNAPGATSAGFLYRVEMAGKTLDPRLRSK